MLKKELGNKYNSINMFVETFYYGAWFQNEELTDTTSMKSDKKRICRFISHATTTR